MSRWLTVTLPADRTHPGALCVRDDQLPPPSLRYGPVPCLGQADPQGAAAHGNLTRDPTRPYGDFPLGRYRVTGISPVDPHDPHEIRAFGPAGKLVLDPLSGDGLLARQHGRYGLLVHGGDPTPAGRLRPTYGCLRVRNADMADLVALQREEGFQGLEAVSP